MIGLGHKAFTFVNRLRNKTKPKVKLVGIAKNEGAYLPDWIFHHLYFGFDAIDIYVNNTTDNTHQLVKNLECIEALNIIDGNPFFEREKGSPQVSSYLDALKKSKRQGFSHILFIDIDEFWTPLDFRLKVDELIISHNFDVMAFEWVHRVDDDEPFARPFESKWLGHRAQQIKILLSTEVAVKGMNAHNIINTKADFKLANGQPFVPENKACSQAQKSELSKPLKPVFLMHRSNRSQLEFVAGLDRSTPVQERNKQSRVFKYNRGGYKGKSEAVEITFEEAVFDQYEEARQRFYEEHSLNDEMDTARKFVEAKKEHVVKLIETADLQESPILSKVLKRITLPEVVNAYECFQNREKSLSKHDI